METNIVSRWSAQKPQRPTSMQRFDFSLLKRREYWLAIIFGLLLVLVVVTCTLSSSPWRAVALIGALALAALAVVQPRFAMFFVFAGAGLPLLVLPIPGHTVRPIELALFLCVLVVIVRPSRIQLRLPHLLALLFMGIALVSFIHVPDISTDVNAYAADKRLYGWFLIFTAFFCGTFLIKYVKNASAFLIALLLSNVPLYLVSLAQALHRSLPTWLAIPQDPTAKPPPDGRLWGSFNGAASFGLYMITIFALALSCWLLGTRRRDRIIGAVMTCIATLIIIGTGTRSAAIAIGVIVVLSFILTRHFKWLLLALVPTAVGVVIFANKIIPLFTHAPASTSNRIFLWEEALKLIAAHPWIGIGLQQFPVYYSRLIVSLSSQLNPHGISVHNQYLEWAMESGIIWLIVGVLLMLSILSACWKSYRVAQPGQKVLLLAAGMALIGNMVGGLFDVPLDYPEAAVSLFLLAGLALGYGNWQRARQAAIPRLPFAWPHSSDKRTRSVRGNVSRPLAKQAAVSPASSQPSNSETPADDSAPNTQKTGRTVVIQLLSWGIAVPLIFPSTALLTRYLGPVQYGEYTFAIPYLSIFALLSGIGMDGLLIRQLSRQPRAKWSTTMGYAAGTRLFFTLLGIAVTVLVAFLMPVSVEQRNILLLGSVTLIFSFSVNGLRMVYSYGFAAEQRVSTIALLETTNRIITAGLIILIVVFHFSLLWGCVLIFYSDVPFFIIQVLIVRRRYGLRIRFSLARLREHLFGGLPLMGYNVMVLIGGQADIFLLMLLAGPLSVGIYALAMRITDPLISIVVAYVTGLYPLLCTKFEEGREQFALVYQEATRILSLGIVPLAIFISVEASNIVLLLGGQHFTAAAIVVQLLMWAMAATFFGQLAVRACMAANKERQMPYVTIVSVGINIVANLVLIPHWTIVGAGIAALVSELIGWCLFSVMLRRHVHLLGALWVMLRVFLGNVPALVFLLFWQQHALLMSPFLALPIAALLVIVGCVATRTLSLKDLHMARHMLLSKSTQTRARDIADWPTLHLPVIGDISDYPTNILPKIKI